VYKVRDDGDYLSGIPVLLLRLCNVFLDAAGVSISSFARQLIL
jgi:hypothetical protein